MDKNDFKISGFARFYRSLNRFFSEVDNTCALKLTYAMYTIVLETYRSQNPDDLIREKSEVDFCKCIRQADIKPYRTEIQLYRAMKAIMSHIDISKLNPRHIQDVLELNRAMGNIELRFFKSFDMDIDDKRTVYNLCAGSLVTGSDEPGVCLLKDWIEIRS
jgi:hypothetical protein